MSPQAARSATAQGSLRPARNSGRAIWARDRCRRTPASMMSGQRRDSWLPTQKVEALQPATMYFPLMDDSGRLMRTRSGRTSPRTRACQARSSSLVSAGLTTIGPARQARPRPPARAVGGPLTRNAARTSSDGGEPTSSLRVTWTSSAFAPRLQRARRAACDGIGRTPHSADEPDRHLPRPDAGLARPVRASDRLASRAARRGRRSSTRLTRRTWHAARGCGPGTSTATSTATSSATTRR